MSTLTSPSLPLTGEQPTASTEVSEPEIVSPNSSVASSESSVEKNITMEDFVDIEKAHYTFPERLMELLKDGNVEEALFWLPGGNAFGIRPKIFFDVVLSKYFQGTKYESFTRKLNRWGFRRLANQGVAQNTVAYYNKNFKHGHPELLKKMRSGNRANNSAVDIPPNSVAANPFQEAVFAALQNPPGGGDVNSLREFLKQQSIIAARQAQANAAQQALLDTRKTQATLSLPLQSSPGIAEALNALQHRARLRTVQQLAMSNVNGTASIDSLRNALISNAKAKIGNAAPTPSGLNPQLTELILLRARLGLGSGL